MVSVPDWAKFAQITQTKQSDTNAHLSKFYKQREVEAVKQAEEYGYFLNPTKEVIKQQCGDQNPGKEKLLDFELGRLTGVHLRVIGDLAACSKLTICLLGNNFLTKVDALVACRHLIRLDLHSNQLTSIPTSPFWSGMRKLQMLHLHDNPLGKFETLQILGSSPILSILTLYDTPLSLKKNYRHHVVNSIWTLKALDLFVISDEEIIEDAIFGSRFSSLSQPFRVDLCPQTPSHFGYDQELKVMQIINAKVNAILAKHSPVLIVQRCLRGFISRKKLGISKSRFLTKSNELTLPPPGTPTSQGPSSVIDYDTYMKNRRPGSIIAAEEVPRSYSEVGKLSRQSKSQEKQRLHVNIEKLETGTLYRLQAKDDAVEKEMSAKERIGLLSASRQDKSHKKERTKQEEVKEEPPKAKRIKDIKQFFGPVVKSVPSDDEGDDEDDSEIPMTDFRIKGTKPKLLLTDATTEMILSRQEAGLMVREAEADRIKQEEAKPQVKATSHSFTTKEQRYFTRTQGTMGLSCLMAVHKAYKEREKAEKAAARMENILGMREERQRAKDRINIFHDERRTQVLKSRDLDRAKIIDRMEKRELQRLNFLDKQQERKMRSVDNNKELKTENSFMMEFNSQHTSVSNALLRHDRQAKHEDKRNSLQSKITTAKFNEVDQQDTVKKYMEHRQLMRQTETAMAKAALDTKMLTEANDRVMEARNRVAHLKAKRASVQAFYPLPPNTVPPSSTAPAGMTRWEAGTAVSAGRVGRHHTIYV